MAEFTTDVFYNEYAIKIFMAISIHLHLSVFVREVCFDSGWWPEWGLIYENNYWGHIRYLEILKAFFKVSHWEKNNSWRVLENTQNENKKRVYRIYDKVYSDKQCFAR